MGTFVMGVFSQLDMDRQLIEAVSRAMEEPALTAEEQMEIRIDALVRDLDELCKFAANPETVDLVQGQKAGVGQIITRAQLIGSFLMAHSQKPGLRVVKNG
jgi:hypothetical protein